MIRDNLSLDQQLITQITFSFKYIHDQKSHIQLPKPTDQKLHFFFSINADLGLERVRTVGKNINGKRRKRALT